MFDHQHQYTSRDTAEKFRGIRPAKPRIQLDAETARQVEDMLAKVWPADAARSFNPDPELMNGNSAFPGYKEREAIIRIRGGISSDWQSFSKIQESTSLSSKRARAALQTLAEQGEAECREIAYSTGAHRGWEWRAV